MLDIAPLEKSGHSSALLSVNLTFKFLDDKKNQTHRFDFILSVPKWIYFLFLQYHVKMPSF